MGGDNPKLFLVGNVDGTNVGGSFWRAARSLEIETELAEARLAMSSNSLIRRFDWWLRGKRPTHLGRFGATVVDAVRRTRPRWLLTVGIAPLDRESLRQVRDLGVTSINFLTDDPWNGAHRAPWFLEALPEYDVVCSTRRANLDDLARLGCGCARYVPFGYDPFLHHPVRLSEGEYSALRSEAMFAGGADADRVPYFEAVGRAGIDLALYGDYWGRHTETRAHYRGYADVETLRRAVAATDVAICLVRKANRDGHVMRTFEVPAVGACMVVEDTEEHRSIFGPDGEAVEYFSDLTSMVDKIRMLLSDRAARQRLARVCHEVVTGGPNTYSDRLKAILGLA